MSAAPAQKRSKQRPLAASPALLPTWHALKAELRAGCGWPVGGVHAPVVGHRNAAGGARLSQAIALEAEAGGVAGESGRWQGDQAAGVCTATARQLQPSNAVRKPPHSPHTPA